MSKRNIIIAAVLVLIVIVLGVIQYNASRVDVYSVVYMTTKEVYVGKLSTFPDLMLTDSYVLTTTQDASDSTKSNFQLTPIKQAIWAPKAMHLIKDNVVFYGSLMSDSKIVESIKTQNK
jgi:hypothetical protein